MFHQQREFAQHIVHAESPCIALGCLLPATLISLIAASLHPRKRLDFVNEKHLHYGDNGFRSRADSFRNLLISSYQLGSDTKYIAIRGPKNFDTDKNACRDPSEMPPLSPVLLRTASELVLLLIARDACIWTYSVLRQSAQ